MMNQSEILEGARAIFESDDPEGALRDRGIRQKHDVRIVTRHRHGYDESHMGDRTYEIHTYRWTFPQQLPFGATFSKEGLVKKLFKVFVKEPEVGDPLFDDNVYVTTSDVEMCLTTLSDRCQGSILNFVQQGGTIEVKKNRIVIVLDDPDVSGHSTEHLEEQYALVAHFAQWVL